MARFKVPNGPELFDSDTGSGRPMLLLHGWTCDGNDWAWLTVDLEADHRIINVDHRGHGRSEPGDGYTPRQLAADAAALVDALGVTSVAVVGHSMGTLVACALAIERPDLVDAAVLIDPAYGRSDEVLAQVLPMLRAAPLETAQTIFDTFYVDTTPQWLRAWHLRRLAGNPPERMAAVLADVYDGPDGIGRASVGAGYLAGRECPVLTIYGGTVMSAEVAEWDRSQPHRPHDVLEVWPEAGHFLHQEQPDRFATRVRAWLAGPAYQ